MSTMMLASAASAPRTLVDLRAFPGGPRAAPSDQRWPNALEPGERETAYDMEYAEVESGEITAFDLAVWKNANAFVQRTGPVLAKRQWSSASDWYVDLLNHVVSDVVELDDEEQRLVGGGSHRMGPGGDMKKRRSEWCRL